MLQRVGVVLMVGWAGGCGMTVAHGDATSGATPMVSVLVDEGEGTLIDMRTGLEWESSAAADLYVWKDAMAHCAELAVAGGGWRLPSKAELESIIDDTTAFASIAGTVFLDSPSAHVWSSSPLFDKDSAAWAISDDGRSFASDVSATGRARCVRGDAAPIAAERYTEMEPGTIDDGDTTLRWQQAVPDGTYTYDDALAYCDTLALAGGGWRLPTRAELLTLVHVDQALPALDSTAFPDTPMMSFFWSATPYAALKRDAWVVYFDVGKTNHTDVGAYGAVRCVR